MHSTLDGTDNSRTYPATYMWYGSDISGFVTNDQTLQTLQTSTTCPSPADVTEITLPSTADPSSLVSVVATTFFGQKESSTSSVSDPRLIPSSILHYLDSLPEVQDQFNHIPITSCAYPSSRPAACTSVVTSTSTSCISGGSGNLSHTSCNEEVVTVTSTIELEASSVPAPVLTDGPILVPRRSAAYLTYTTLTPSDVIDTAALNEIGPISPSTSTTSQSKQTQPSDTAERIPSNTGEPISSKDSKPTTKPGENPHTTESQPAEAAAIGILASIAATSREPATATGSEGKTDANPTAEVANQQSGPNGATVLPEPGSLNNLLSALQGAASQVSVSQDLTPTAIFGGSSVSQLPNHDGVVIDKDHTVLLSDGEATTIPKQPSQELITISRSGSALIVNGQTLPADREITAGQITASASSSGSSVIMYIDGTPVSTGVASLESSTGMGGYIYSGIGGGGGGSSATSDRSPQGTTGSVATPFTGDGLRTSLGGWSFVGLLAFLGVVCLM